MLEAATDALEHLEKSDITEVKAMKKPPKGLNKVAQALCYLFSVRPKIVKGPDGAKVADYWSVAKQLMGDPCLLSRMISYDKDHIPEQAVAQLERLCADPMFA